MRSVLDSRLHSALANLFKSTCVVWSRNRTQQEDTGQWVEGTPTVVPGLSNLPCRIGPLILIRPTDTEERTNKDTAVVKSRQLKFNGYFPQIDVTTMYVVVDGIRYNILGHEEDGHLFSTRLRLEVIEPNG